MTRSNASTPHDDEHVEQSQDATIDVALESQALTQTDSDRSGLAATTPDQLAGPDSSLESSEQETIVNNDEQDSVLAPGSHAALANRDSGTRGRLVPERYQLKELLGEGAFGKVFRAWDSALKRHVAIKIAKSPETRSRQQADLFLDEAQKLAGLHHPAIVDVFDVGMNDEHQCYVVSRFIDGTDLSNRIRGDRPSVEESVHIVIEVAEALHHAHTRGLVHRDVKPANILLETSGQPFLADFGLALRDEDVAPGSGATGTPSYMSPEQARGGNLLDGRSDVFSLGIVFYELLTGERPFKGKSTMQVMEQIRSADARPPRQRNDRIPKALEEICLRAIARELKGRYSTARDFADDLREWQRTSSAESVAVSAGSTAYVEPSQSASGSHPSMSVASQTATGSVGVTTPGKSARWYLALTGLTAVLAFSALLVEVLRSPAAPEPAVVDQPATEDVRPADVELPLNPFLIQDVRINFQRADQIGSFDELAGSHVPLRIGDRLQIHLTTNEPVYACLFWFDEAGKPARIWPDDLADQRPVSELYVPPMVSEDDADNQQWISVAGAPGLDTILAVASVRPVSEDQLRELESCRVAYRYRDAGGVLQPFNFGSVRPAIQPSRGPVLDFVLAADAGKTLPRPGSHDLEAATADPFRVYVGERFQSYRGLVFFHE